MATVSRILIQLAGETLRWRDAATIARGRRVQRAIRIPDSRSRQHLCDPSRRVDPPTGDHGTEVTAAQSQNQCDLRARDRHDPQGMSGLANSPFGSPPALHPQILDRPLQRRTPTYGVGTRHSRSPRRHPPPFKSRPAPSPRWIVCRPSQADPWRATSRVLVRASVPLTEFLRKTRALLLAVANRSAHPSRNILRLRVPPHTASPTGARRGGRSGANQFRGAAFSPILTFQERIFLAECNGDGILQGYR